MKTYLVILVIIMISLFSNCEKKYEPIDDTFFGSKTMILGHRGMGDNYYRPTNTYESVFPLFGIGADGSEMDIQMTKDSVLVLFHDNTMDKTTTCTGRVFEQNWNEIKQCKYYALKNMIFMNSVDELFSKLPNITSYYFSFDCKIDNEVVDVDLYREQYLRAIKRVCEKYHLENNVVIEGDETLLKKAQELGLKNKLFYFSAMSENDIDIAIQNHFYGISVSLDKLDNIEKAHNKGLRVMSWSPNNYSQNKSIVEKKVDIVQTDDPISMLKLLERFNYDYVIP